MLGWLSALVAGILLFAEPALGATPAQACAAAARYPTGNNSTGVDFDKLDAATAIRLCEAALATDPDDHSSRANLARALSKAGRHEEKLAHNRRAAEGGNLQGMRQLALALENGEGVSEDKHAAFALMKQAAEAGYAPAMDTLGQYLSDGTGTAEDDVAALVWTRRAFDAGDVMAINNLAVMHEQGEGLAKDQAEANRLYRIAAERGQTTAMRNLGEILRTGRGLDKNQGEAVAWFRKAVEAGDKEGYNDLGYAYQYGEGVARDDGEALRWYRLGHEAGDSAATASLGRMFELGRGVEKDLGEANRLYALAAADGNSFAMINLGDNHRLAIGVPRDHAEALRWYRAAAEADDSAAFSKIGAAHEWGEGVPRDPVEAVKWYRKGYDAGDAAATDALASMTYRGQGGIAQDLAAGMRLYREAADLGSTSAMRNITLAHYSGNGTPLEKSESLDWHRRAAESGDALSMFLLGERYFKGDGAAVDLAEARKWLQKAAEAGDTRGGEMLARATLADTALAGRREQALEVLLAAAERGEGWAVAALAYPGPALDGIAARIDTGRWRSALRALRDEPALIGAVDALKNGHLAAQQIDIAIAVARQSEAGDAFAAVEHQSRLLLDLKLVRAALTRVDEFMASAVYEAAPQSQRTTFDTSMARLLRPHWRVDEQSVELIERFNARGFAGAANTLGHFYADEGNPKRDLAQSVDWYRRAVELGDTEANNSLGVMHSRGSGVEQNSAEAARFYRLAADAGSAYAKRNLGELFLLGRGVEQNDAEAARWLSLAAREGVLFAEHELALLRFGGRGGASDPVEAIRLLRAAHACGYQGAAVTLARAYFEGAGVARDPDMGVRWLKLAAARAGPEGQLGMARAQALGWGMPSDMAKARAFLIEARNRGSDDASDWLDECGEQATLECLRAIDAFVPRPLMVRPVAVEKPLPDFAAEQARLEAEVRKAIVEEGGVVAISGPLSMLVEHYSLYDQPDALVLTELKRALTHEFYLARVYGRPDNYFALFESNCTWSTASRNALAYGRPEAAVLFAKIAVNKLQAARARIAELDDDIKECFVEAHRDRYRQLAEVFLDMGRFEEAENVLAMLKDFEHATWTSGDEGRGRSLAAMPMSAPQQAVLARIDAASAAFSGWAEARARKSDVALAETAFDRSMRDAGQALAALERDGGATIAAADPARAPRVQAVLQTMRRADVVALQAVVGPRRIHWLLTTPAGQKVIPVTVELSEVAQAIRAYRQALIDVDPQAPALAKALYDAAFAPVDAELRAVGAAQVMLSLDDVLRYIPFAALHDGKGWLVERYAFSNFRDASDLGGASARRDWTVAGFGATKAAQGLSALPKVADELAGIVKSSGGGLLPGTVALDEAFDASALGSAVAGESAVIHIASHFALDSRGGGDSFLLLGTGEKLPLAAFGKAGTIRFGNADFLALSACQTGVAAPGAKGIEIESMAEIAQNAGAPAVLASLWKVADESTSRLMVSFYGHRSAAAAPTKSAALRSAQLDLIAEGRQRVAAYRGDPEDAPADFSHPYFWAPFVLLGDAT